MIYFVSGTLFAKGSDTVIVQSHGVGYQIFMPESSLEKLPALKESLTLFTYHHVREDSVTLFGFLTESDRSFFIQLTAVSGVGPKVGLKILSTFKVVEFVGAVLKADAKALTTVPGVGKKVAERLILELKDKLPQVYSIPESDPGVGASPIAPDDDMVQALKGLGYRNDEIKRAYLRAATQLDAEMSVEETVKILLKQLS